MRGYLAGYPVVDFKVTVFDGSYHQVDSDGMSFKMAGSLAFKDGMSRAEANDPRAGDDGRDLRAKRLRGRSDWRPRRAARGHQRHGHARGHDGGARAGAVAECSPRAAAHLRHRRARLVCMEYSRYEEEPSHRQPKMIAAARAERAGVEVERSGGECRVQCRAGGADVNPTGSATSRTPRYPRSASPCSDGIRRNRLRW